MKKQPRVPKFGEEGRYPAPAPRETASPDPSKADTKENLKTTFGVPKTQ